MWPQPITIRYAHLNLLMAFSLNVDFLASQTHRSYSRIFYPPKSAKLNKSFEILFTKDYGLLPYSKELLNIHHLLLPIFFNPAEGSLSILQSMRSLKLVPRPLQKSPPPWFSDISSIFVFVWAFDCSHACSLNNVSFYLDKSRYYSLRSKSTGKIGYTSFKSPKKPQTSTATGSWCDEFCTECKHCSVLWWIQSIEYDGCCESLHSKMTDQKLFWNNFQNFDLR